MKKSLLITLFLGTVLAMPFAARAQGSYVGINIGRATNNPGNVGAGAALLSRDETNTGFKVYGGIGFTRNWGAEVGYADLGKVNNVYRFGATDTSLNYDTKSLYIAGTGTLPLNDQFSLFAKFGVTANRTSGGVSGPGLRFRGDSNKGSVMGGIGATYNFSKNLGMALEYEDFGKVDDGDAKARMWSVGMRYKF
jgi:OOP family OmpA-OmpF porin